MFLRKHLVFGYLWVVLFALASCLPKVQNEELHTDDVAKTPNTLLLPTSSVTPMNVKPLGITPIVSSTVIPTLNPPARIAYIAGGEIGVIDQQTNRTILVKYCQFCNSLSWSPDGNWIAFEASFKAGDSVQIYAVNVGDSTMKRITSGPNTKFGASWSPDAKYLVYVEEGDPTDLAIVSFDGSYSKKITYSPGYEMYPAWSPDGKTIAFLYRNERFAESSELWLMDQSGKNRRKVTDFPISLSSISWSPDGKVISFVSGKDCGKLFYIGIDGNNLTGIGNIPGCVDNSSWSPDGEFIMFLASESETNRFDLGNWQIYLIRRDGSSLSKITSFSDWRPTIAIWDTSTK